MKQKRVKRVDTILGWGEHRWVLARSDRILQVDLWRISWKGQEGADKNWLVKEIVMRLGQGEKVKPIFKSLNQLVRD